MKQFIAAAVLVALFGMNAQAQASKTVTGYLVDKMCASGMVKKSPAEAMEKAAKHTRDCALEEECSKSGYGVVSDGAFMKFDDKGDAQAKAYLTKTKHKDHLLVDVVGVVEKDKLMVTSLKDAKPASKKAAKKS